MVFIGTIPRRSVNLPSGSLWALISSTLSGSLVQGPAIEAFYRKFEKYLGSGLDHELHVIGAETGRSAFELALRSLDLPEGCEIVFPTFTFPVMPMVAKLLGYRPVFCDVDPQTFNSGPEQIEPLLNERTGAILATHLFGRPCPIREIAELADQHGVKLVEDCAHALGVRVDGRSVGTFGDIGMFSFAEGKNMPCMGGGALAIRGDEDYARAQALIAEACAPAPAKMRKLGTSVWIHWLVTRPLIFGLTAYQILRLKQRKGEALMDSAVGNQLLAKYEKSDPRIRRFANLQARIGLKQLDRIDAFNAGAKRNAEILTEAMGEVPHVQAPPMDGEHIYVYYPLRVDPDKRDDLRHYLLREGVDTKTTDMSACSVLDAFREGDEAAGQTTESHILEICVYPVLSARQMRRVGSAIRTWALKQGTPKALDPGARDPQSETAATTTSSKPPVSERRQGA